MRNISIAMTACAAVLLTACRGESSPASPTTTPEVSTQATEWLSPSVAPTPSPAHTAPSGEVLEGFALNDILRVEVNRLAVRVAPYTHLPLATGWTLDGKSIGEVRLNIGDFVSVDLGPVKIGDTTWYRVWPAEGGQLHYSTISWDTKNNGANPVEPGWVAAAVGDVAYLTLHEAFEPDPSFSGLPLLVSGTGGYLSGPLESTDLFVLAWVYLIDDQTAPCDFTMTLVPDGGGEEVVAVDTSTIGFFEESAMGLGAADGTPVVGTGSEPFRVRVMSDCEWSLLLEPQAHD